VNWHAVFSSQLIIAMVLTAITIAVQIGAYAARYVGVITGRIATAISLFSLFVTASRLAALFQTPMLGTISDRVAATATQSVYAVVSPEIMAVYDTQMRLIVASGTVGIVLGGLLMPIFISLFTRGIKAFERHGSIPRGLVRLLSPRVLIELAGSWRVPRMSHLSTMSHKAIPRSLLVANTVIFAVYSVGVVAAYYASVLALDSRTTATGLSGLVNGVGTIAFSLFVDPTSAYIVDQTVRGERTEADVRALIFWLIATALVGTILAQLILYPAAWYIADVARLVRHPNEISGWFAPLTQLFFNRSH
jgi:hypothetical protein